MKRITVIACAAVAAIFALPRVASTDHPKASADGHVMLTPDDLTWVEAPSSLPRGAQVAMLEGDPSKDGPFTMRIKVPAGYKIPPHTHPQIEHVTVLSGSFLMGSGGLFEEKGMKTLPAGSFALMPAGVQHYAMAKEASIVQVHGTGPWGITYVNPEDDPRNAK